MKTLLKKLRHDFPALSFTQGPRFVWSPVTHQVLYKKSVEPDDTTAIWALLHEVGHAVLGHGKYGTDFELVQLESAAWVEAEKLAKRYDHEIDPEHIQDCLDTYRDWLYQRSTCPACTVCSLQTDSKTYTCFNCGTVWRVSKSRLCRAYRRKQKEVLV
jgi:hypothetical protein